MSEGNGLSTGWARTDLETVAVIRDDLRQPVNATERANRLGPYPYYGATGQVGWIDGYRMDGEYVLLGEDGAPFLDSTKSKAYMVSGKCWVNNHAHVLHGAEGVINNRFLMYALNATDYHSFVSGTTRLKLTQGAMKRLPISLPPLTEQRRVVAAIEEQFARLDAGVAALERARANLKRYRASVLKAAVEGRLTEEWREQNSDTETGSVLLERILEERRAKWEEAQLARYAAKGQNPPRNWRSKYEKPAAPDIVGLPELPEEWMWATLGQLSGASGYGTSQKCGYEADGPPVLRIPNVSRSTLDFTDIKYGTKPEELRNTDPLAPNDLLVIRTNGSRSLIGRSALVRHRLEYPHYFASYLIRFRILDVPGLSSWLATIWDASTIRTWIESAAATSAGQYNISIGKLNDLVIPLPTLAEQEEIVAEVERRLSVIEEVEAQVEADLKRAARLRQSILKRAFEGKLVPQDPSDEPASVLLERIREERVQSPIKKPKRKKPAKQNPTEEQVSLF